MFLNTSLKIRSGFIIELFYYGSMALVIGSKFSLNCFELLKGTQSHGQLCHKHRDQRVFTQECI